MRAALSLRDRLRAQLADLKMLGALEALDDILAGLDGGTLQPPTAIEALLGAQIALRNNRRLQAAMRSSRLPVVKTLADFDFSFQPSVRREQLESLHTLGFIERKENRGLRIDQTDEPILFQALVTELPVEAFDVGVLHRFARLDEIEHYAVAMRPLLQHFAAKLRAVVADNRRRIAAAAHISCACATMRGRAGLRLRWRRATRIPLPTIESRACRRAQRRRLRVDRLESIPEFAPFSGSQRSRRLSPGKRDAQRGECAARSD
jgi:IstB-like ATP binding protein